MDCDVNRVVIVINNTSEKNTVYNLEVILIDRTKIVFSASRMKTTSKWGLYSTLLSTENSIITNRVC